jgi:hypothetical protein
MAARSMERTEQAWGINIRRLRLVPVANLSALCSTRLRPSTAGHVQRIYIRSIKGSAFDLEGFVYSRRNILSQLAHRFFVAVYGDLGRQRRH